jgi:GTPase Era involved in 16S rRNA processing
MTPGFHSKTKESICYLQTNIKKDTQRVSLLLFMICTNFSTSIASKSLLLLYPAAGPFRLICHQSC